MAVDDWLLNRHVAGAPPVLRFYTWEPTAISLGYHQRRWPENWQTLTWQGRPVDLVRRPTGGRAVLHQGDLTYALVLSGLQGTRMEIYQHLCQFLIQGFKSLGVELALGEAGRGYIHNPNCFGTATGADLVMAHTGAKLIGSAQVWRQGCVLQHGSIRLHPDAGLFETVFGVPMPPVDLPRALTELSVEDCHQRVVAALTAAAAECFAATFETAPLTPAEIQAAADCSPLAHVLV